ncbi:hypothetical protein [Microbulbifer sp. PAAF003]|uniref:hypothetical protein n=1 Tax=Microbulbifer sp. PAAF003 TaxID=3243375 RepID=UPI00403A640F
MNTLVLLIIFGYLIIYMFLGLNFLMILMEQKIKIKLKLSTKNFYFPIDPETKENLSKLFSTETNPSGYLSARVYGIGSFVMLLIPIYSGIAYKVYQIIQGMYA